MQSIALCALHVLLLTCFLYFCHPTIAQDDIQYSVCSTANNYTSGSAYEQNLNLTLSSLTINASLTGFYMVSVGQNLDVVYGLIQCRGDISMEDCRSCTNTAAEEITQLCPYNKEAARCSAYCLLRYSDWRFFSIANSNPRLLAHNVQNETDPVLFNSQLGNLVSNLASNAASSSSKFSVGITRYTDFINIYAMVQCTRDLSENSCLSCLLDIISQIPACCDGNQGGRVFSLSCNLRFEIYSFFQSSLSPPGTASPPTSSLVEPDSTPGATTNSTSRDGKKSTSKTIVIVVIPVAVALVAITIICGCFFWRKAKTKSVDGALEDGDKSIESLLIGLKTLRIATSDFSDAHKLGQGGFGPVYKGKLFDGREIAVKRLSRSSGQGLEELKTEVMLVAKLLHRNLVRLLAFCLEEEEKLLVYEYLPNGSLDKILFDQGRRFSLDWERRYKIIVGIARGLLYLHEDSQLRIIHRDLKVSNILLDEYMNPKISDFGLARLFDESQVQGNTNRISGTYGYMAPEYAKMGHFSTKSDVYSFGVLVLEILIGRKNSSFRNAMNLQSHAWKHWANGTALELLDPTMGDQWPRYEVLKCIRMALLCVQEVAADRPTMTEIVTMLSSYKITSPAPLRPAFFFSEENFRSDEDSGVSQHDNSKPESLQQSVNDVTITELDAR